MLSCGEWDAVKKCGEGNGETVVKDEITPENTRSSNDRIKVLGNVDSSSEREDCV